MYTIYMYTFPNGKKYIGKTKRTLYARQGEDLSGYKRCRLLWRAIQKYGAENIRTDILFYGELTDGESCEMERYYIALYKTNANRYSDPAYGYNLTDGGDGVHGWKPTEERRQILIEQMRALGKAHTGTHPSEEARRRLSESHKGLRLGYKMPEETTRKIGEANSLKNMSEETRLRRSKSKMKPVLVVDPITNEKIVYESHGAVSEKFGVRLQTVAGWIDGSRNAPNNLIFSNYSPTTTE